WDTATLPDGAYYLKIVATDAPSNPPSLALKTERESERFVVDNTPPVVEGLKVETGTFQSTRNIGYAHIVQFTARDVESSIDRAQYSLDGGEWILVEPVGGISDALEEHYEFTLAAGLSPGEHTIAMRAYDRFENVGSAKTTFILPASKP